ncbi:glycine zipper 2TM domain-containing protein [Variovorax sp. YR216]|uniref:glycine zipper 2TM domain-containing protein n=1 Tax=Variovorax sp. YR216 TaxID=1882828 RepID=UPI00089B3800|nr:glycine zipper 2TM domain-containing protein [Variovorax sp. YR216]SEA55882.1 Glycine zipper 2TM domain-containing protein [Variovorax sp. YR216]
MASTSSSPRGALAFPICALVALLAAPPVSRAEEAPAAAPPTPCSVCGKVESVRQVKSSKPSSGAGAVAGGVVGGVIGHQVGSGRGRTVATVAGAAGGAYAGNKVEKNKNAKTVYEVSVRMQDGSMRTVQTTSAPPVGQAVTVKGDSLQATSSKKK